MKVSYFYLLLNIHCTHCTQNCIFCTFRRLKKTCFVTKNYSESSYICVFILSKSSLIDSSKTPITQEWLVVESCSTPLWIAFLMFNRLVYNIPSHFNELILVWSGYDHGRLVPTVKNPEMVWNKWKQENLVSHLLSKCILTYKLVILLWQK